MYDWATIQPEPLVATLPAAAEYIVVPACNVLVN